MSSKTIYVLCSESMSEGIRPLMGFESSDAAEEMRYRATEHEGRKPILPADDNTKQLEWYETRYELWRREHPFGSGVNISGNGRYVVVRLPLRGLSDA